MNLNMRRLLIVILFSALSLVSVATYALPMPTDVGEWLSNLQSHLPAVLQLIIAGSYVIGLSLIVSGIFKLKAFGQQTVFMSSHAGASGPLIYITIGLILFYTPAVLDATVYSFWMYGLSDSSFIGYPSDEGADVWGILDPVIAIVRIVGYIAFIRGWLMLARLGQQGAPPGTIGKAFIHIIGGVMAINIMGTWHLLGNTVRYAFSG